jgi:hypothetical protein
VRLALIANGVDMRGLTVEDAGMVARILEATGRTVPAEKWVEDLAHEASVASFAGLN